MTYVDKSPFNYTMQWECQEQFAREPLFGRTYFRHSSPLLRGILFLSWTFFHFRFLLTEKWRFLSLKNYIGNILQQNRQKRSASWSSYQIIDDNIPFYTSFSIGNVRWILLWFYLPLPDFFNFGTNFWALFDFHENLNKSLSPHYLPTCKNSRPPIPACVWIWSWSRCHANLLRPGLRQFSDDILIQIRFMVCLCT